MKICIVSTPIFRLPISGYGGLEAVAWYSAKGLAELGHEVYLVAPDGSECPGVQVIPCGVAGQCSEQDFYGGYREIKEKIKVKEGDKEVEKEQLRRRGHQGYWQYLPDMDVICDHSWQKWSYGLKQEGKLKAPVLGVMHAPINTMYQTLPMGVDKPCFVCISEDQRQHFEAFHGREARCCRNGVDTEHYQPLDIPRSDRFLFLARFSSVKGGDLAVQACREAVVGLDLVGDTSITAEPEFFEKCKRMCDGKQIRMVGPCGRGESVWWYSQAHALLHPNQRFREPFGLAPVEAMLCNCPVIAWNYGAMRETVLTGAASTSTGKLVSSFEQLVETVKYASFRDPVWDGERVADTWRKNCRKHAEQFSIQAMVRRYERLCQEALDGGW